MKGETVVSKPPKVMIATPCLMGNMPIEFVSSMLHTQQLCSQHGVWCDFSVLKGDCFIGKARNNLAKQFLDGDCDSLFFIDSDQGWDQQAFVRMLFSPHEIVAGAVPKKTDTLEFNGVNLDAAENGDCYIEHGCLRAKHIGTGFMRIKRSVFEKMIAAGVRKYKPGDGSSHKFVYEFFKEGVVENEELKKNEDIDGQFWGEDLDFCDRWVKMGNYVWIDPNITFSHVGPKTYKGNLYEYLKQSGAVKEKTPDPVKELVIENEFEEKTA